MNQSNNRISLIERKWHYKKLRLDIYQIYTVDEHDHVQMIYKEVLAKHICDCHNEVISNLPSPSPDDEADLAYEQNLKAEIADLNAQIDARPKPVADRNPQGGIFEPRPCPLCQSPLSEDGHCSCGYYPTSQGYSQDVKDCPICDGDCGGAEAHGLFQIGDRVLIVNEQLHELGNSVAYGLTATVISLIVNDPDEPLYEIKTDLDIPKDPDADANLPKNHTTMFHSEMSLLTEETDPIVMFQAMKQMYGICAWCRSWYQNSEKHTQLMTDFEWRYSTQPESEASHGCCPVCYRKTLAGGK